MTASDTERGRPSGRGRTTRPRHSSRCGSRRGSSRRLGRLLIVAVMAAALGAWTAPAHAQNHSVVVTVSPRVVVEGEDVTIKVRMQGDYDQYQLPEMGSFKVLGRHQSSEISITNGDLTQTRTVTIRALPKRTGTLTVGPAMLFRKGALLVKSKPYVVKVRKERAPDPKSGAQGILRALASNNQPFLHATLSRPEAYVGEPVALIWNVYMPSNLELEQFGVATPAKLVDFMAEDIPEITAGKTFVTRRKQIGGRWFKSYRVSGQLLTPLKAGNVLLDQMSAEIRYSERQRFGFGRRKVLPSKPYYTTIKPLPAGAPKGFEQGNVGSFRMNVSLRDAAGHEPRSLQTGQRLVLKVTVQGTGNIGGMSTPTVSDAEGRFEVQQLPSGKSDGIIKSVDGVEGKRHFEFLLTPIKPGEYETPRVTLVTFDPSSAAYNTAVGSGKKVKVTGAPLSSGSAGAPAIGGASDIGPIAEDVELSHRHRGSMATSPLFWILFALPLMGFAFVEARYRQRGRQQRNPSQRRSKGAVGNARKRLAAAQQALDDGLVKDFYGQIARTLIHFFEERAQLPATGLTHDELRTAALPCGYAPDVMDEVITELENCDFARFAPSDSATRDMRDTVARIDALLGKLAAVKPSDPASDQRGA